MVTGQVGKNEKSEFSSALQSNTWFVFPKQKNVYTFKDMETASKLIELLKLESRQDDKDELKMMAFPSLHKIISRVNWRKTENDKVNVKLTQYISKIGDLKFDSSDLKYCLHVTKKITKVDYLCMDYTEDDFNDYFLIDLEATIRHQINNDASKELRILASTICTMFAEFLPSYIREYLMPVNGPISLTRGCRA